MSNKQIPVYLEDPEFLSKEELDILLSEIYSLPFTISNGIGAADDGVHGIEGSNFADRLIVVSEPTWIGPWEDGKYDTNHPTLPIAERLGNSFCHKHGLKMLDIYRTRVNLTTLSKDHRPLTPHVDLRNRYKHYILLMFFNDSDGDTIMYTLTADGEVHSQEELTTLKRFSPKAGYAVLMDADYFHAWEHPKDHDYRLSMIINMAIEVK
jgi:hypothetical protein